ncbi:MAG: hypothetical protein PVF48_05215 [Syntrophobacterales bacterium]
MKLPAGMSMNFIPIELVIDFPVGGAVSAAIKEELISHGVNKLKTRVKKVIFFIDNLQIMIDQLLQWDAAYMPIRQVLLRLLWLTVFTISH